MSAIRLLVLGVVLAGVAFAAAGLPAQLERRPQDREVRFIIPAGNARREANGQPAVMLPKMITLTLGRRDTLIIRNEDGFAARIAGIKLESGQQYRQRFRRAGTYEFVCSTVFHEDLFRVVVVDQRRPLERLIADLID